MKPRTLSGEAFRWAVTWCRCIVMVAPSGKKEDPGPTREGPCMLRPAGAGPRPAPAPLRAADRRQGEELVRLFGHRRSRPPASAAQQLLVIALAPCKRLGVPRVAPESH